jgi:hypothetical protein
MTRRPRLPVSVQLFAILLATLLLVTSGAGSATNTQTEPISVSGVLSAANPAEHTSNRHDRAVAYVLNEEGLWNAFVAAAADFVRHGALLYVWGGSFNRAGEGAAMLYIDHTCPKWLDLTREADRSTVGVFDRWTVLEICRDLSGVVTLPAAAPDLARLITWRDPSVDSNCARA